MCIREFSYYSFGTFLISFIERTWSSLFHWLHLLGLKNLKVFLNGMLSQTDYGRAAGCGFLPCYQYIHSWLYYSLLFKYVWNDSENVFFYFASIFSSLVKNTFVYGCSVSCCWRGYMEWPFSCLKCIRIWICFVMLFEDVLSDSDKTQLTDIWLFNWLDGPLAYGP